MHSILIVSCLIRPPYQTHHYHLYCIEFIPLIAFNCSTFIFIQHCRFYSAAITSKTLQFKHLAWSPCLYLHCFVWWTQDTKTMRVMIWCGLQFSLISQDWCASCRLHIPYSILFLAKVMCSQFLSPTTCEKACIIEPLGHAQ